jgi:hypothetical protein
MPGLEETESFEFRHDSIARYEDSGEPALLGGPNGPTVIVGIILYGPVLYGPVQGGARPTVRSKMPFYAKWIAETLRRHGGQ